MRKAPGFTALGIALLFVTGCAAPAQPAAPAPAPTPTRAALAPAALGDGGRIAVALKSGSGASILTVNPDGSDLRKLTQPQAFDACPDLGPGGTLIAFCSDRSGVLEIWLMDGGGGSQRRLTTLGGDSIFPDISPDGQRVAFCGSPTSQDDHDIWVINVDGTGLVQLTNTVGPNDCDPVWSPDGSALLFDSTRSGTPELYRMDATGQGVTQLTSGQQVGLEPPDWSPNGQQIAYIAQGAVWTMKADGSEQRRLTTGDGEDYAPAWSPKGNEIVYRHSDKDGLSLRIVSVSTGQVRQVPLGDGAAPLAPSWQQAS